MLWKYTSVQHGPRKRLGLSPNEYCVCDLIYKTQTHPELTQNGWTNLGVHTIAEALDFSSGTIKKMLDKFEKMGLLEFKDPDKKRFKKMLPKWYNTAYLEPEDLPEENEAEPENLEAKPEKTPDVQKLNVQKLNGERSKSERENGESVQKVNEIRSKSEHYNNSKEVSLNKEKEKPQAKSLHSLCRERFDFWSNEGGFVPIYWDRKEIGQLQQLINRLQDGAKARGFSVTSHEQFVKDVFDVFCGGIIHHCRAEWFAETFTPSGVVSNYNKIVQTIKIKINGTGKASSKNGGHKSGHLITSTDAAEIFRTLEEGGY